MTQEQRRSGSKRKGPSKAKMAAIRAAFDADALIRVCEMDQSEFANYGTRTELEPTRYSNDRFYVHADNGSKILAVAHLDHVQANPMANVIETAAGLLVTSGALDDRLGAYVILELLPKLGMTFDYLLTTDEEDGASTADDFYTGKQYNWIIEFDRGGTDVVMYDYETKALCDLVEESGARVGKGSFSDIACLEHLGAAAFNWGVGYEDYHSSKSHAWLEDTFRMVARFWKFHEKNRDTFLIHQPRPLGRRGGMWWEHEDDDEEYLGTGWDDNDDWGDLRPGYSRELYEWLKEREERDAS